MSDTHTVHIVPHTHWDREWYLTKQQFSLMLTRVIDRLIDILDTEPDYPAFTLDGQTIALEDYLELQPGARDRVGELIAKGRIIVGPWYVLPDEVLVSGEAHIRNFFEGMRVAREFGGA
ncbi:MAG: hypothetical protein KAU31_08230 [Spirochaetaceae bacterium]|nr:hypothetical protein [Spirochaetaceae bacterium]